jgi:hypothetical protein
MKLLGMLAAFEKVLHDATRDQTSYRGGAAFSDTGVSGFLPGQYSNRRADIHEKAKT